MARVDFFRGSTGSVIFLLGNSDARDGLDRLLFFSFSCQKKGPEVDWDRGPGSFGALTSSWGARWVVKESRKVNHCAGGLTSRNLHSHREALITLCTLSRFLFCLAFLARLCICTSPSSLFLLLPRVRVSYKASPLT